MALRKSHRRAAHWLAVAFVGGVLGPLGFNIVADKLHIPGLRDLNDYITRRA